MAEARDQVGTADLCIERKFYFSMILITHTHTHTHADILERKCLQTPDTTTAKDNSDLGFKFGRRVDFSLPFSGSKPDSLFIIF